MHTNLVKRQLCLTKADFTIKEVTQTGSAIIQKCSEKLFDPKVPSNGCGAECPCWRVVPSATCKAKEGSSP